MAHKPLIDGTAYEITGGKTLVDGTAYSIKIGKTLVDGTAYEIGFGSEVATITFSSSMPSNLATYIEIDGVKYTGFTTSATGYISVAYGTVVEVPLGTTIVCVAYLSGCDNDGCKTGRGSIYLNGSRVEYVQSWQEGAATYSYTVNGNINISATQGIKECSDCEKGDITNTSLYIATEEYVDGGGSAD